MTAFGSCTLRSPPSDRGVNGPAAVAGLPLERGSAFSVARPRPQLRQSISPNGRRVLGIEKVLYAPPSLWQNDCAERLIGSIQRECLGHVIVVHESGLRRALNPCFAYYAGSR